MFGGKKQKEALNKIQELEITNEKYQQLCAEAQKVKDVSDEVFVLLEAGDAQLDQGLNHIVDIIKEEKENTLETIERTNVMSSNFQEIASKSNQIKDELERRELIITEGRKAADILQETVELCDEMIKNANQREESTNKAFEQSFEELGKMQEVAKSMTTLALNAAIEAGRLGEAGVGFLQAAESVRKLSEEYTKMMGSLKEQMQNMHKLTDSQEQKEQLNKVQKKVDSATSAIGTFRQKGYLAEDKLTGQIFMQQEIIKEIEERLSEKDGNYQAILEQMEFIGQNFMDNRNAKIDLEEKLKNFYENTLK